jgi:hypothetical protein
VQTFRQISSNPKIDSLRLRIPIANEVKIISDELGKCYDLYETDVNTGETITIEEGKTKDHYLHSTDTGIQNPYNISNQKDKDNKFAPHLVLGLPSKLVKHNYFQGIDKHTLEQVYEEIQAQEQVTFSYEAMLKAQVTDIDICKDVYLTQDEYETIQRYSKQNVLPSTAIKLGYQLYKDESTKKTLGFQFNIREQDYKPFEKFYSKELEIRENPKMKVFYESYLQGTDIKDLKRIELTIKNKTQLNQWYGIKGLNTMENLLSIPQEQLSNMINIGFHRNTETNKSYKSKETGLTSMDILAIAYINAYKNKPLSVLVFEITEMMKENDLHRNTITKTKQRLKQLFTDYHKNTNTTDKNIELKNLQKAFTIIGLNDVG